LKFLALSFTLLSAGLTYAQTEDSNSSTAPVARVYVTRPTHLDVFNVSSSRKLTPISGSPFSNISLSHLSINKKFLFGASDDQKTIITYSIASNGAPKILGQIDTSLYNDETDCAGPQPTLIDHTGVTIYNYQADCDDTAVTQSYKIEENGELQYLSRVLTTEDLSMTPTVLIGNNDYAYNFGSKYELPGVRSFIFKRESDGTLDQVNATVNFPKPAIAGDVYDNDRTTAVDSTDHIVLPLYEVNPDTGESDGPDRLYSHTADSKGNLTTTNTLANAPTIEVESAEAMSISPSAKLLAVGGGQYGNKGFQVFHFNGASPITKDTGLLHSSENFLQFGWDKDNHLFALSTSALHIYSATPTSVKEEAGSPISIPEASSVIVQSLN